MHLNLNNPVAFSVMTKPIGSQCNLNCTYCYYLEKQKLYADHTDFRMSDVVVEKFIKSYIQTQQVSVVNFLWQGGEPSLLGIEFFQKVLRLQQKYAGSKQIDNAFQTNGTKLNDDWCKLFKQHNFLVGISIDGPEEIHNMHRPYKSGQPTFSDVMQSIELLKKHNVDFNTMTVINRQNAKYPTEIYQFLKKIGSGFMQFIPIVERTAKYETENGLRLIPSDYAQEAEVTEWSVIPEDYGNFLISVFDEWVCNDVGRYFVQMFDVTLANWVGAPPGLCVFNETCGNAFVIEHNGDLYSCDHFVYPKYLLGNIMDTSLISMVSSQEQDKFGMHKVNSLPSLCINCDYRFACHGECPKHRFLSTPDGQPGLSYLCVAYKKFFAHVHPYMQFMGDELAAKRAPANVMAWAKRIKK